MITGIVRYWNLGRSNAKGDFEVNVKDEDSFNDTMLKEFSKHLMSSDISFDEGKIYAGFRNVGNFEFIAVKEQ